MSGKHEETALVNRLDSGSMAGMTATDNGLGSEAGEPQDVGVDGFGTDVGVEDFGYDG